MAEFKPLGQSMDISKVFAHEDGKSYRGHRQDMDPVLKHVEYLKHKVNEAPKSGNPRQWQYRGSVTWPMVVEWLE